MTARPRLLAVDDAPSNLVALEAVLGREYELVGAKSGAEAISILERDTNFDVILMDIQMPQMDGYEAATRIKQLPGCADIPLVFITAVYNADPHVKRGYAVGAMDYFTKPFDPDILKMKLGVYASFRHRTALIRARERQLAETESVLRAGRKLAAVLEGLPVGVMIADRDGRVSQMNEGALRILQSASALDTDAYGELISWWERNAKRIRSGGSPLERVLKTGEPSHNVAVEMECIDGTKKTVLESTSPLRDLDGSIAGAVIVIQDVTEPKKFEADFEQRIAHLVSIGMELERTVSDAASR